MADVSTLVLRLKNRGFNRGVQQSTTGVQKMSGATNFLRKALVGLGLAVIGKKLVDFGISATKAAIDAEETGNKFLTVFSEVEFAAENVAETFSKEFGLASSSAQKLLADTGDLLVGFGFTEAAALDLSKRVNELAVDLASFTNIEGGTIKASQALTKLLVGETEQAKSLGIVVRQSTKAYNERVKAIMESQRVDILQAKALANLEIAFSQSTKAIGDFRRTQNSAANVVKRTKEAWKGLREEIGKLILRVLDFGGAGNTLIDKIESITETIKMRASEWIFTFGVFKTEVVTVAKLIGLAFGETFKQIQGLGKGLLNLAADLGDVIRGYKTLQQAFEEPFRDTGFDLNEYRKNLAKGAGLIGRERQKELDRLDAQLKANEDKRIRREEQRRKARRQGLQQRVLPELPGDEAKAPEAPKPAQFAEAARAGSEEAVRILASDAQRRDKVEMNTKKTADNTKKTADVLARAVTGNQVLFANFEGNPA